MFGRMRAASSLDGLERPPAKIIKDDSLSIYEVTLMKLKEGSRNEPNSYPGVAMNVDTDYTSESVLPHGSSMAMDIDCSSSPLPNSIDSQPTGSSSNEQQKRTVSVVSMFSKYMSSRHATITRSDSTTHISSSSSNCQVMDCLPETDSSAHLSCNACNWQTMGSTKQQIGGNCASTLPVFQT